MAIRPVGRETSSIDNVVPPPGWQNTVEELFSFGNRPLKKIPAGSTGPCRAVRPAIRMFEKTLKTLPSPA